MPSSLPTISPYPYSRSTHHPVLILDLAQTRRPGVPVDLGSAEVFTLIQNDDGFTTIGLNRPTLGGDKVDCCRNPGQGQGQGQGGSVVLRAVSSARQG